MIDIHNHILYGVDDGSKDLDMSLAMLKEEMEQGVSTIYLTPHQNQQTLTGPLLKERYQSFLEELKEVLGAEDFNIDNNLLIIKSSKDEIEYSTNYTMMDLDYDSSDIVERLKELNVSEYSETLIDKEDDKPPLLFVFGKDINSKLIYIKLKIKGETKKKVLCLSFHYAKHNMEFPYK
jgi:hypothetical protein